MAVDFAWGVTWTHVHPTRWPSRVECGTAWLIGSYRLVLSAVRDARGGAPSCWELIVLRETPTKRLSRKVLARIPDGDPTAAIDALRRGNTLPPMVRRRLDDRRVAAQWGFFARTADRLVLETQLLKRERWRGRRAGHHMAWEKTVDGVRWRAKLRRWQWCVSARVGDETVGGSHRTSLEQALAETRVLLEARLF